MPRTLDHLVLCVADLEPARASYRDLGFTLTPPATHPFGTRNSLVQLPGQRFLELLALDPGATIPADDGRGRFRVGAHTQDFLRRRGEGMSMLVFASTDARADVAAFRAAGLVTYEPFDFGREATLPDGEVVRVAFSLAFVTHPQMPDLAFFSCQQRHAPELFWKPAYQHHANGAEQLVEVVMEAAEPQRFAEFFARLTGAEIDVEADGQVLHVGVPPDRITMLGPAALRTRFPELDAGRRRESPRFVGYRIAAREPHRVGRHMVHGVVVEFGE